MDIGSEVRVIDVEDPVFEPHEIEIGPIEVEEPAHDAGAIEPKRV